MSMATSRWPRKKRSSREKKDVVTCTPGAVIDGFVLNVPAKPDGKGTRLSVVGLQTMSLDEQVSSVFGQQVAVGELTSLVEDMFPRRSRRAVCGARSTSSSTAIAGVYFLEAYDPNRVPVLFITASTALRRSSSTWRTARPHAVQAWVYYYPSGLNLATIARAAQPDDHQAAGAPPRERFGVVAYSMGGW
jgi:hypothetical protein